VSAIRVFESKERVLEFVGKDLLVRSTTKDSLKFFEFQKNFTDISVVLLGTDKDFVERISVPKKVREGL
jgi:hypothetical protein